MAAGVGWLIELTKASFWGLLSCLAADISKGESSEYISETGRAGNAGKSKSYADMSTTGEAEGKRHRGSGSSPSISGKLGTPAMSVASNSALLEEPMVGEGRGDWGSSGPWA